MTLGAEPKKLAILGVLVVVALAGLYLNSSSDTPTATTTRPVAAVTLPNPAPSTTSRAKTPVRVNSEVRPVVPGSRPGDKYDLSSIDPQLHLDLLAKVQAVELTGAGRNLFQFGPAPAPDKPIPAVPANVPKIAVNTPPPPPPPPPPVVNPAPPPPPPINLKYYGVVTSKADGRKRAFLTDGDDIIMATENETVKQRYRIVRITPGSIDIEDIPAKNTQTLKFQEIPS